MRVRMGRDGGANPCAATEHALVNDTGGCVKHHRRSLWTDGAERQLLRNVAVTHHVALRARRALTMALALTGVLVVSGDANRGVGAQASVVPFTIDISDD